MSISIKDVRTQLNLLAETLGYPTSKDEAIARNVKHYVSMETTFTGYSIWLRNIDSGSVSRLAQLPNQSQSKTAWYNQLCAVNSVLQSLDNNRLGITPSRVLSKLDTIVVIGRRCLVSGNTYHSCTVYINGAFIDENKFTYGYKNAYQDTAYEILSNAGYLPKNPKRSGITNNTNANVVFTVSDVNSKKDL